MPCRFTPAGFHFSVTREDQRSRWSASGPFRTWTCAVAMSALPHQHTEAVGVNLRLEAGR
jgi:hypothetical protein